MTNEFYLVWSPQGCTPPRYRHESYAGAETEARRLAECHPHAAFFVMKAESISVKQTVVTHRLPVGDDIPF
jgi:hypothetical protein